MSNEAPSKRGRHLRRTAIVILALGVVGGVGYYVFYYHIFKAAFAEVVPGEVYRSNQPSVGALRRRADKYGFRTVISLRGDQGERLEAEQEFCQSRGIRFVHFAFSHGQLPEPKQLLRFIDALEDEPRPLLIHCRSGMDRAAMGSAVAVLLSGEGFDRAMDQVPLARCNDEDDHICDLLAQYRNYCHANGKNLDDPDQFRTWVEEVYTGEPDPDARLIPSIRFWP